MTHPAYLRDKARELRINRRLTIDEIADRLALPRTTIFYAEGRATFAALAADPSFRDFVCLYLAEGSKRHRNEVQVCNSDSAVVKLCDGWLRRVTSKPLHYSIQYHADQDLDELRGVWARELDIDPEVIRIQRKSNSDQLAGRTWRSVHGVLAVAVYDTLLRARIGGWMDRLRESWS